MFRADVPHARKLLREVHALTVRSNNILVGRFVIRIKKGSYFFALEVSNIGTLEFSLAVILRQLLHPPRFQSNTPAIPNAVLGLTRSQP